MGKETQAKGNIAIAIAQVILDITNMGFVPFVPFVPIYEHPAFDLIVVNQYNSLSRVQVKYARLNKYGAIVVRLYSSYSNGKGTKSIFLDRNTFDAFAVYCPDTKDIYYIKNSEIVQKAHFNLKVTQPLSPQRKPLINGLKSANMASDYLDAKRLFDLGN